MATGSRIAGTAIWTLIILVYVFSTVSVSGISRSGSGRAEIQLTAGAPTPSDLCRRPQRGFARLNANSEEAETVRPLLATAVCV